MRNYRIIAATALAMAMGFSSVAFGQETRPGAASGSVKDVVAQVVDEPAGSSASVLLTRQGQRLDLLETDLRDMRGILETDVRNLKMQITQLGLATMPAAERRPQQRKSATFAIRLSALPMPWR